MVNLTSLWERACTRTVTKSSSVLISFFSKSYMRWLIQLLLSRKQKAWLFYGFHIVLHKKHWNTESRRCHARCWPPYPELSLQSAAWSFCAHLHTVETVSRLYVKLSFIVSWLWLLLQDNTWNIMIEWMKYTNQDVLFLFVLEHFCCPKLLRNMWYHYHKHGDCNSRILLFTVSLIKQESCP